MHFAFEPASFKSDSNRQILSNELIDNLPNFAEFLQLIGSGSVSLAEPQAQQQFGFVFMKKAEEMMDQRYQSAYELLINKQKNN